MKDGIMQLTPGRLSFYQLQTVEKMCLSLWSRFLYTVHPADIQLEAWKWKSLVSIHSDMKDSPIFPNPAYAVSLEKLNMLGLLFLYKWAWQQSPLL